MDENRDIINMLDVKETDFTFNKDFDLNKVNNGQVRIGVRNMIEYKEGSDYVFMFVGVKLQFNEKVDIFTYNISCKATIKGWKDMSHKELDVRMNPVVNKWLSYCYAYLCGAIKKHLDDNGLKNFYLPVIDASELISFLLVKEVKS